jgi:hypothetical protein
MSEKTTTQCRLSPGVRLALCVGIGAALSVSNNPATGIAVAAGLWLALTLGVRR